MSKQLINSLKNNFEKDIRDLGYELVDIEFIHESGENYLRFYIFHENGVSIDDCEKVSKYIDPKLDDLDLIKSSYYLEVSSPDLSRPLKTDDDLRRNLGKLLDFSLYRKVNNKKEYRGILLDYNDNSLVLIEEAKDPNSEQVILERKDVSKIQVAIVF